MKLLHGGVRMAAMAMAAFLMNTTGVDAQQGKEITFPYDVTKNESGPMPNGYDYEMWKQDPGTVKMTVLNEDAKFNVEWNGIQNVVARVGLKYDETQTHEEIGTFTADFEFQKGNLSGGLSYYGIYGWTVDPLVEFYVMEDWEQWRPTAGDGSGHQGKGTINVDGSTYDIVTRQQNNQPSIKGNGNFPQVFSIRQNKRQSGTISISEHFKKWESLGISFGKMYEVKIKVEAYSGDSRGNG
ncbi:MAG: glycoside hydrolase family 11 protein, partial [Fibrobacter sp.]|nr:glycoside hydrolase family 11 protein [Fibrobacter sp.]